MKTDARVRYTRMRIEEAFFTLLEKKPINRITVRELCDMAEINRATFYTHYTDVYDLMEQLELQVLEEIRVHALEESNTGGELLTGLLRGMTSGNTRAELLASQNGDPIFHRKATDLLYELYRPTIAAQLPHRTSREQDEIYCFICGGCASLISRWFESGCILPPEKVSESINSIVKTVIESMES